MYGSLGHPHEPGDPQTDQGRMGVVRWNACTATGPIRVRNEDMFIVKGTVLAVVDGCGADGSLLAKNLSLSLVLLDNELYKQISARLRDAGFEQGVNKDDIVRTAAHPNVEKASRSQFPLVVTVLDPDWFGEGFLLCLTV
ncbi:MAG: hypothetical protein HN396_17875 [Gemmatimonadales bacterium]|nr:hypothetical protein [Gemmatimonadales bacterium]